VTRERQASDITVNRVQLVPVVIVTLTPTELFSCGLCFGVACGASGQ